MSIFSCNNQSNRVCDPCEEQAEFNRIIHVAFVKKGTTIAQTTPTAFATALLSAEMACNAVVIRNVNGTYDGGAITTGKGYGKEPERVLGMTHSLVFGDKDIIPNIAFYNDFKRTARGFDMYFMTDSRAWEVKSSTLSVAPKVPITDDNNTKIEGEVTVKWNYKDIPVPVLIDTDAFELCQELNLTLVATTFTLSGSTYSIPVNTAGGSLDMNSTASGTLVYALLEGTLPTGMTLNASNGIISGTPTVASTKPVTLTVTNECGLVGSIDITIVVTP